ncbi:MAG: hypothetical protein JNG88_16420 [Phycisphaerales bacterium]|nr:hypothetical protein [Phycisphaerales bacterium]
MLNGSSGSPLSGIRELLEGYVEPTQRRLSCELSINTVGETGLTSRIATISFLQSFLRGIGIAWGHELLGYSRALPSTLLDTCQSTWLTEILRVMDPPTSRRKGESQPVLEFIAELAVDADDLPEDFAAQHEHYVKGALRR